MSWTITISGSGPRPSIMDTDGVPPPPLPPPPPPPPPLPPVDNTPFDWPSQPGLHYDPAERYADVGENCYAGAFEFENPLPASYLYAGIIQSHRVVGSWDVFGWRLWTPASLAPATIRRLLATGR